MDARIARTKRNLQDALLELARERSLDDITVGDIAEHAGVNRSSFYQHYSDKDVLLADALDVEFDAVGLGDLGAEGGIEAQASEPPAILLLYLEYIQQNASVYQRVLGDNGSAVVTARVRQRIEQLVLEGISRAGIPAFHDLPAEVVAASIAGSALGAVRAWLELRPRPSSQVAASWLWRLLQGPGETLVAGAVAAGTTPA